MLFSCTLSQAQKRHPAPKEEEKKLDFSFRSIAVSADVFGFAYSLLEEFTSSEFAVEANFGNRIYPTSEV